MTEAQADSKAREIISKMSLKEKVYEMSGHGIVKLGLSILYTKRLKPIHAGGNEKLGIPPTVFMDGPRGIFYYKGATAFPTTMARGASWDVDLEKRVGEAMAEEVRALGGNYSGAVSMNLLRHPAWGRSQETYGEDPYHVGEMASALTTGIQKHHVQACVKHYAVNSMENNRFGGSMNMDERTLREVYLPHFKKVIQRGGASVMSAYNRLNGEYCGHHKYLLTDILRNDWGFKGYVTSDWKYGLRDTRKGIEAGMNIEMPYADHYKLRKVKKLVRKGIITEEQLDDLIFPIIRTKLLFAWQEDERTYPKTLVGCREHIDLAREVAEKSAVLLKNEGQLLPLDKNKVKRIAVIGSLAQVQQTGDHGSSTVFPAYIVSPLEGITRYLEETGVEVLTAPVDDLAAIKEVCGKADIVVVVAGTTYKDEGEYIGDGKIRDRDKPNKRGYIVRRGILGLGGDREYLHLHQKDIDIILNAAFVNPNVVVSLVAGSAVTVEEWQEQVPAIMETFYNGMEGGTALARILFGEVNPSGKLPFSVPVLESDLPPFDSYAENAEYGYYHGYTLFDKEQKTPRYPFGFGLSYTSFALTNLQVAGDSYNLGELSHDSVKVSVTVQNTGTMAGAEVVQLYVAFPGVKVDRPEKLLRGFKKVHLQPGESQTVQFTLTADDLSYWEVESKTWVLEKGEHLLLVGTSSRDENMLTNSLEVH